jgi:uncharacterized protein (UPF0335 family)
MPSRNGTPTTFGFDFQYNAAILLALEYIKTFTSIRIEGASEDIELTLDDEKTVYAQAKSVGYEDDYRNVIKNLGKALTSLSEADCKIKNCVKLIYITNSPNPFNDLTTMGTFIARVTRRDYSELPEICRNKIDGLVRAKNLAKFDSKKFAIRVFQFFTSDPKERYKVIDEEISKFLQKFEIRGISEQLMSLWQASFQFNSTQKPLNKTVKKKELIWLIIALEAGKTDKEKLSQEYDDAEIGRIEAKYNALINNRVERLEFSMKIADDYSKFAGVGRAKTDAFIKAKWRDYSGEFAISTANDRFNEIVTKIIIQKILKVRYLIEEICSEVNL